MPGAPVPVARGEPRAPDPADLRRPGEGRLPPVPRALRHPPRRGQPPDQRLHPLHLVRRLPVPGAGQGRCRDHRGAPGPAAPERDPAGGHRGDTPGDRRRRPHGHRRGHPARERRRGLHRRHRGGLGRGHQQRQVAVGLGQRRTSQRAGQRLGPGRAQLHVPQLQGRRVAGQGAQRDRLPEDARAERLLLRRPRLRLAVGQHPDGRQVQRRGHEGRRTQPHHAGAPLEPGGRRLPRRRLVADHRGPPPAREPGDARRRGHRASGLHVDERQGGRGPLRRAEEDLQPRRHGPAPRARTRTST